MKSEQLERLKPLLAQYNIELQTKNTMITHVNGHVAEIDATGYMPDQLITLILEIVGADLRKAFFENTYH